MSDKNLILIGVDETGYGAIAGPLTVCAAMVYPEWREELEALRPRDSKALSPERRLEIAQWIVSHKACEWAIVNEPAHVVDKVGPFDAVCKAARTALLTLTNQLDFPGELERFDILMDGKWTLKGIPKGVSNRALVGADDKVLEVMVASILAKVHRDFHMEQLDHLYPIYGWNHNKGYGIGEHLDALFHYGPMAEHRMTAGVWRSVKNHWEKKFKPLGEPLPVWLAQMNPRYARDQQNQKGHNPSDQTGYTSGPQPATICSG